MSRVGKWMSTYWDMVARSAAWSTFPDLAHEIYGPQGKSSVADEGSEGADTLPEAIAQGGASPLSDEEG